jgi:hypothetical protein
VQLHKTCIRKPAHKHSDPSLCDNKQRSNFLDSLNGGTLLPGNLDCKNFVNYL